MRPLDFYRKPQVQFPDLTKYKEQLLHDIDNLRLTVKERYQAINDASYLVEQKRKPLLIEYRKECDRLIELFYEDCMYELEYDWMTKDQIDILISYVNDIADGSLEDIYEKLQSVTKLINNLRTSGVFKSAKNE